MKSTWVMAAALCLSSLAYAAGDPEDAEGTKDHPDVARFPGTYIEDEEQNDYNEFDFVIGEDGKTSHQGGRYWRIAYRLKDGAKAPSPIEVVKNYENAFKKKGGVLVYKDVNPGSGIATYKMPLGKSERWLQIDVGNAGEAQDFTIVDVKEMEQKVEVSATEMFDALSSKGRVALHGILFDTGKDAIKPESEPLLNEIAKLLQDHEDLKLSIEGHTDNQGNSKANQALSQKRAESVKKWLVAKGVDAKRLKTAGFGDTKPVAPNSTEDGRAQNRRVELVKQ